MTNVTAAACDESALVEQRRIRFGLRKRRRMIPKAHCTDFLSVPDEDLHEVLRVTQMVARALVGSLRLDGFNIFSNNGRIAGQSVFHFHMHVTPRYADDNIRFVLQLKSYTGTAMAEYARRIREHLTSA